MIQNKPFSEDLKDFICKVDYQNNNNFIDEN